MFRGVFFLFFDGLEPVACSHFTINMKILILQAFHRTPWREESTRSKADTQTQRKHIHAFMPRGGLKHYPSVWAGRSSCEVQWEIKDLRKNGLSGLLFNTWKFTESLQELCNFTAIHLFISNGSEKVMFIIIKINQEAQKLETFIVWNVLRHVPDYKLRSVDL
jgi:hypothetical protein